MTLKNAVAIFAILMLIGVASGASNVTVVKADTTVFNSVYLDIGIWYMITLLGLFFLVLSNLTTKETGAPLWAIIAPFFTFTTMFFSTRIQYAVASSYYNPTTNIHYVLVEHAVYHLDWFAVGLFGIIFILSVINMLYVLSKKPLEKAKRSDIYGSDTEV